MSRIRPPPPSPSPSTLSPSRLLRYTSASLQHFLHERASQPAATHTHTDFARNKQRSEGRKRKKKRGGKLFLYRSGERSGSPQSSAARSLYPGRPFFVFLSPDQLDRPALYSKAKPLPTTFSAAIGEGFHFFPSLFACFSSVLSSPSYPEWEGVLHDALLATSCLHTYTDTNLSSTYVDFLVLSQLSLYPDGEGKQRPLVSFCFFWTRRTSRKKRA